MHDLYFLLKVYVLRDNAQKVLSNNAKLVKQYTFQTLTPAAIAFILFYFLYFLEIS